MDPAPNPLQKDIDSLNAMIQSRFTSENERRLARHRLRTILEHLKVADRLEGIASSLHLSGIFSQLPDEDLAKLVSPEHSGLSRLVTRFVARARYVDYGNNLLMAGCFSDRELSFQDLHSAVRYELFEEFKRRRNERETPEGRLVRELLVEEDERDPLLLSLAERTAARLSVPDPAGWKEGQSDARSEAATKIWEMVRAYADKAPGATAEILLGYLTGRFNKTLKVARDGVRSKIRTECRRRVQVEYSSEQVELRSDSNGVAGPGLEDVERKVLLEQIFAKAKLSQVEAKLVLECSIRNRGQEIVARELGLSQTAVSRSLKRVLAKLSRVSCDSSQKKSSQAPHKSPR